MTTVNKIWKSMVDLSPTAKIATSLIAKDVVGCIMYTSTARSNPKYTPEKRSDVANYDLANGIINIGLQLLAIKPIETAMTKVSDSKLMKHFFKNLDARLGSSDNKAVMTLLKHKAGLVKGSVAALSVVICQYFIKRFVSPYFSMPASEKFKEWRLIKPKLYEGETFEKPSKLDIIYDMADVDNIKKFADVDNIKKIKNIREIEYLKNIENLNKFSKNDD